MSGNERWRLRTEFGRPIPSLADGEKLLAAVDLLPPEDAAELDALDDRIGEALRAGCSPSTRGSSPTSGSRCLPIWIA